MTDKQALLKDIRADVRRCELEHLKTDDRTLKMAYKKIHYWLIVNEHRVKYGLGEYEI